MTNLDSILKSRDITLVKGLYSQSYSFSTSHVQIRWLNHKEDSVSSVQSLSCVQLFAILWTAACQASLHITNSQNFLKLMSIESVIPFNCLILCHPIFVLPSIFPSIRTFSNELVLCLRWPRYWSFSFSISHSNEYSGLVSFRIDWFSPCSPRDSEEPLTPQFKSINSLVLSFLYGRTLTSIYDYWKSHSFD